MYSKGKIYKITDTANNECYYGSTIQPLSKRMGQHRIFYKAYKNGKYHNVSSFILFDKYGVENCSIVLVENVECKTKEELHQRERFYIENNECVNKFIPGRTNKEWYEDNKEYQKKYIEANKEKIKEYNRNYYRNYYHQKLKKTKDKEKILANMDNF